MVLHSLLHLQSLCSSGCGSISIPQFVNVSNRGFTSISTQICNSFSRLANISNSVGNRSSKNNQIKQRICSKPVSSMNRCASSFTCSIKSGNNLIFTILISNNLSFVVGRYTTHVVMDSRKYGNRLTGYINTSKDH